MLSPRLLAVLREYWAKYRPRPYLFPGREPDQPVSPRTVQMVCQRALEVSGLSKHVHVHTLCKVSAHYTTFRIMAYFQVNSCCPGVRFRSWRPARTASTAA